MWVATGSYAEPLQSDEQPESWTAFTPDLHTARLTANRMREMNFDYRMNKLCPAATAPGFFSHQSDSTLLPVATLHVAIAVITKQFRLWSDGITYRASTSVCGRQP